MRKPWWPRLIVDLGDNEKYEFKSFMASEMEQVARLTNGEVDDRFKLYGQVLAENPTVWRALIQVLRKRNGIVQNFDEVDVDLDVAEAWCVDDTGREVDIKIEPQPCNWHKGAGLTEGCEKCGTPAPSVDAQGRMIWFYVDKPDELVPTERVRRFSTEPVT